MPHRVQQKWVASSMMGHRRVAMLRLQRTHVGPNGEARVFVPHAGGRRVETNVNCGTHDPLIIRTYVLCWKVRSRLNHEVMQV
jgi:hypothetical protein